ncbi:glutamyl-tRNA amidotransferase subunit A [Dictyobacter sp. S3.2.2.5]|uniref:Glutamyl-tRNA amidotransferase subunit A n=1 Tax=Dictyobacter halimunensis TaxID=3026934 RepID=A0ABQ6FSP7_9CHLR|nr:glutamyl-tRNA amidotransferase subunit A [Dictyobacter sp. S3.2.2.5]
MISALTIPLPLASTAAELRSGQRDLLSYINDTCDRIDELEPHIQALLPESERRARLLAEATSLQQRFPDPEQRPPLYGVLLGVKDIFRADGFPTQAGSQLPAELFAGPEASCVSKLRDSGALVLGKTVSTEFASDEPGPTRNPHHLAHTPGGSSSGSAAAVASGFCSLALGTQTMGSVIRPAAFCGVVGFKPTYGRIATDGLIFYSPSVDTIGLFTQDVAGMATVAPLLCADWQPVSAPTRSPVLAVPEGPYLSQTEPEALANFWRQVSQLEKGGYTVRRVPAFGTIESIKEQSRHLTSAEMALGHAHWFATYASLYRPRTVEKIRGGQQISLEQLTRARAGREALRNELEGLLQQANADLWICPAAIGPAPEGLTSTGATVMNLPWSYAGLPALSLPAGRAANSLPLGLQLVAPTMADEQLLAWASLMAETLKPA